MRVLAHNRITVAANIANGQTVSQAIDIRDFVMGSYRTPAALTGTALSFQVSLDGANFNALTNETADTAATSQTASVGKNYSIPQAVFNYAFFKIVSGSAEGAARAITVFLRA
jgi:hypothetical protein